MFGWFKKPEVQQAQPEAPDPVQRLALFSTHHQDIDLPTVTIGDRVQTLAQARPQRPAAAAKPAGAIADVMDEWDGEANILKGYERGQPNISDALANWYGAQGFIGHQLAAMVAQHWLIMKACAMPARDAIRHGFTITTVDGDALEPEVSKKLKRADKRMKLNKNLLEFVRFGRVFGIRICIFKVDYGGGKLDDEAYAAPFNIDGVRQGAYKGMVQIDPYWCSPELDGMAAAKPDSMHFYEPTWWQINGRRYHRSHLMIFRNSEVADILKPSYLYGGIPVPQLIMERVYGAERTANEAPLLALTKRTTVYKTDVALATSKFNEFSQKMMRWARFWNNNGIRVIGEQDEIQQIDTSLTDLDSVIMTQYQLVAAGAGVPSTKLLGTAPKGFNATGEFDESSYHEELESLQAHDLTPFVERHHALVIRSELPGNSTQTSVSWEPLDSPTAKEYAEINKLKAETGKALVEAGAIDGTDERARIANDKNSDYADIDANLEVTPAAPEAP